MRYCIISFNDFHFNRLCIRFLKTVVKVMKHLNHTWRYSRFLVAMCQIHTKMLTTHPFILMQSFLSTLCFQTHACMIFAGFGRIRVIIVIFTTRLRSLEYQTGRWILPRWTEEFLFRGRCLTRRSSLRVPGWLHLYIFTPVQNDKVCKIIDAIFISTLTKICKHVRLMFCHYFVVEYWWYM